MAHITVKDEGYDVYKDLYQVQATQPRSHEATQVRKPAPLLHGDLIDSTMMTTDECGSMGFQPVSYTAFGEPVWRDGQGQTHVGWPFPPAGAR